MGTSLGEPAREKCQMESGAHETPARNEFCTLYPDRFCTRSQEKSAVPAAKTAAEYVGGDTCKTCHEDLYKNNFERTSHFKIHCGRVDTVVNRVTAPDPNT